MKWRYYTFWKYSILLLKLVNQTSLSIFTLRSLYEKYKVINSFQANKNKIVINTKCSFSLYFFSTKTFLEKIQRSINLVKSALVKSIYFLFYRGEIHLCQKCAFALNYALGVNSKVYFLSLCVGFLCVKEV